MALTRKFLSALGIEAEKIDEIINAHSETVNGLKEERDTYKKKAEDAEANSDELEKARKEIKELQEKQNTSDDDWKKKYDKLKGEYDTYKSDIEEKATQQTKINAFKKLLKEAKVSDKRVDTIVKVSGETIGKLEIQEDGTIKDSENLVNGIKKEWADFIVTDGKQGASVSNPPANTQGKNEGESRAAQLANQYHNNIYGANKEG